MAGYWDRDPAAGDGDGDDEEEAGMEMVEMG